MQSDSVLCLVIILADCYCGARTHLEFERLMPKGANFAQAAHPPWVILAARPLHVWKTFYGYYQKSCHMNWESPIFNRLVSLSKIRPPRHQSSYCIYTIPERLNKLKFLF